LELDQGGDADDLAAEAFHQAGRGPGGAAGGEHVVDDQDPLAGHDGVGVQLQGGGAVLQRVLLGLDLVGQLAGLADGDEAGAEVVGDRRGQDEPAGLDGDHLVDVAAGDIDRRARVPTTVSTSPRPNGTTASSITDEKPTSSASNGVMSLKTIPGLGNSGT